MIPNTLQTKLDTLLSDTAQQVATIQEAYRSAYGRYWQGLRTHAVIPADGATAAPDLTRKPSDQAESWSTFAFALPAQTEGALSVDVYQSRKGQGYIVNADVVANGIRYRRSAELGPESGLERGWGPFQQIQK